MNLLQFFFSVYLFTFFYKNNYEINNLIPTLAIFTAATFRILPSINKILVNFQTIRFSKPAIDLIYNDFLGSENISKIHKKTINVNFVELSFKNIYFKYKRDKDFLLNDINLKIGQGKLMVLLAQAVLKKYIYGLIYVPSKTF